MVSHRFDTFQSTPPRGRRHDYAAAYAETHDISIHSAARAETAVVLQLYAHCGISIHSAARAETRRAGNDCKAAGFQSTPPRGRRRKVCQTCSLAERISIHSAARAETKNSQYLTGYQYQFQSTPPRGRRLLGLVVTPPIEHFNPLRREGGDIRAYVSFPPIGDFNPLRREGGDISSTSLAADLIRFQSTPPRGRRLVMFSDSVGSMTISIHSAARAETAIIHNNLYYSPSHFHKQII